MAGAANVQAGDKPGDASCDPPGPIYYTRPPQHTTAKPQPIARPVQEDLHPVPRG